MKVVHVIASSGLYGAEKWILALMRAMDSSTLMSTLVNFSDVKNETSAVVLAARERGLDAFDFYTGGAFNPFCIVKFSRWLKSNKIHIVHGHGYKSDFIGLLSARLSGRKIISTPHGWSKESDKKLHFYERLDRFLFRFMDYVCPLSVDLLESVRHCAPHDRLRLILNGVDIDEVGTQAAYPKQQDSAFRIGYVGQLIERKNMPTLIKSLRLLSEEHNEARLIIVGGGPEKGYLQALTKDLGLCDKVDFLGYRKDAVSIMKSFDAFVLPSMLEGIPRCVMEAMAARVPVVASDIPGNRELVQHGVTGMLFSPTDEEALSKSLNYLIRQKGQRILFAENAFELITRNYSNHRMAAEYSHVYSSV